jgi:hypothetical protein
MKLSALSSKLSGKAAGGNYPVGGPKSLELRAESW